MLLMIDNYDSFTYNLVQYLGELGEDVVVHRNDELTCDEIEEINPQRIVISPGPCTPNEAGISMSVVERFGATIPLLGVCLGHQCIGQVFGGNVQHADKVMHGKLSDIYHSGEGLFEGIEDGFTATRYHSLIVDRDSMPDELEVTAWSKNETGENHEVMGLKHKTKPIVGVQFHPESIKTEQGHQLLQNFLNMDSA